MDACDPIAIDRHTATMLLRIPFFLLASLALTFASGDGSSQDRGATRVRIRGEARTLASGAWQGATVVLRSEPEFDIPEAGVRDVQIATTDADGRFAATLLRGRRYTAFAYEERADSVVRRSRVVRDVVAGSTPIFVESHEPALRVTVHLHGLGAWRDVGEFAALLVDEAGNRIPVPIDSTPDSTPDSASEQTSAMRLPVVAGDRARIYCWCGTTPILVHSFDLLAQPRRRGCKALRAEIERLAPEDLAPGIAKPAAPTLLDPTIEHAFIGKPAHLSMRVLGSDGPIEKATIEFVESQHGFTSLQGQTNQDGRAELTVPNPVDEVGRPEQSRTLDVQVLAPGHQLAPRRIEVANWISDGPRRDDYEIRLDRGIEARVRILGFDREPEKNAPVLVLITHVIARSRQREVSNRLLLLRTDDAGVVRLDGLGDRTPVTNIAVLERGEVDTATLLRIALDVDCSALSTKKNLVDAPRIGSMRTLSVLDPDRSPAAHARVEVVRAPSQWHESSMFRARYRTDRRGRVRVQLTNGAIAAASHEGFRALPCSDAFRFDDAALQLEAYATCRGTVRNREEDPVPGARIRLVLDSGPMDSTLSELIGELPRAWNMTLLDTVTDSDGQFDLRWIRWPAQDLTVSIEVGDKRKRVVLTPADGSISTDLRFDVR